MKNLLFIAYCIANLIFLTSCNDQPEYLDNNQKQASYKYAETRAIDSIHHVRRMDSIVNEDQHKETQARADLIMSNAKTDAYISANR